MNDMTKIKVLIDWDTECDGEIIPPKELNLPTKKIITINLPAEICDVLINTIDADSIVDYLSDKYGYCVNTFLLQICGEA